MFIVKIATAGLLCMIAVSALVQAPPIGASASYQAALGNSDHDSPQRSHETSNIVPAETNAPDLSSGTISLATPSRVARVSLVASRTGD
jgi:hypothetical protein